ncbi:Type II secretion system protein E [Posidoniimonas polymericola]|uniref:Type II secretion system protein E n=2 Tax=Posidoniimonas polymericola TaxID=2528002 RepID=A0A5C5YPV0_9BACT|nr:Type II secretion system protein E [Posidoniimonas polymericola]
MLDQWYFEIGDGQVYGPFSLDKLRKWAESGDLMPTHRVRHAESDEWVIAAYVKGLELTTAAPEVKPAEPADGVKRSRGPLSLSRKAKTKAAPPVEHKEPPAASLPTNATDACREILNAAIERRASDIHIDPEESIVLVQLRVDGVLEVFRKYPKDLHPAVLGRFKVLSNMDIAEKRMAQDGRFTFEYGDKGQQVDIRAACLPTTQGERLTLRLLATEAGRLTLNRLGMSEQGRAVFASELTQRQGMILLTGPTGAGKSTTLYAALKHRLANRPGRIITVEDPVEYDMVGVSQVEVDTADKVAFGTVLRNILRSDPDVIMIGEMRDYESASTGVKAALTGHLVLSSLHTNSAAGAATRLIDLGVEPFLVAATVRLSVAQRLVRRLCMRCRKPRELTALESESLGRSGVKGVTVYDPGGCQECGGRGYHGRVGVFELMVVDDRIKKLINDHASESDIRDATPESGGSLLIDDAVEKLLKGLTSYEEVMTLGPF